MSRYFAVALLACACAATVQRAPQAADEHAKRFAPAPGHANLYIYRPDQFTLSAQAYNVNINGNAFGSTGAGTYLFAELSAPGTYTIDSQSEVPAPVVLQVEPNKNYFFRQDVAFGTNTGRSTLQPVDEATGREGVGATERLVTHPVAPSPLPVTTPAAAAPASAQAQPAASEAGCSKDNDCKGERICEAGRCVEPPAPLAQ
jgi:hypothetical protein